MNNNLYRVVSFENNRATFFVDAKEITKENDKIIKMVGEYKMVEYEGKKVDYPAYRSGLFDGNFFSFEPLKIKHL